MFDFKSLLIGQFEAAFKTIFDCIDQSSDEIWNGLVGSHTFNQSVFHALFFADVYLGKNLEGFEEQAFHRDHVATFGDYEEWEDRKPANKYTKKFVLNYLEHCRAKTKQVIESETESDWAEEAGFEWQTISRGEMHVYNIRHLQHHAAQLILRLRLDSDVNIGWHKSGWS